MYLIYSPIVFAGRTLSQLNSTNWVQNVEQFCTFYNVLKKIFLEKDINNQRQDLSYMYNITGLAVQMYDF